MTQIHLSAVPFSYERYALAVAPDRAEIFKLFDALNSSEAKAQFLLIEGEPRSKARPRFSKSGHAYNSQKQRDHELRLKQQMQIARPSKIEGNIAIACIFYRSSKGRIDIDNLLKQVLDAATGIIWTDDMQVTACVAILRFDRELPRTAIAFGSHNGIGLDRSNQDIPAICKQCGAKFAWRQYPSDVDRRGVFCSLACKNRYGRSDLRAPANCRVCGKSFQRKVGAQSLCSEECRLAEMVDRNRKSALPQSYCQCCGVKVSRPEYRRCRKCFIAGRTAS